MLILLGWRLTGRSSSRSAATVNVLRMLVCVVMNHFMTGRSSSRSAVIAEGNLPSDIDLRIQQTSQAPAPQSPAATARWRRKTEVLESQSLTMSHIVKTEVLESQSLASSLPKSLNLSHSQRQLRRRLTCNI